MIKIFCDRCEQEIKPQEKIWHLRWDDEEKEEGIFDRTQGQEQYCEDCRAKIEEFAKTKNEKVTRQRSLPLNKEKVEKMIEEGYTHKEIAKEFGCVPHAVSTFLWRQKKNRKENEKKITEKKKAEETAGTNIDETEDQPKYIEEIIEKFLSGAKINSIAAELGIEEEEVKDVIRGI